MAAFAIAVATTPAGVSGAVLLLPFQVSVLGTPSPAVTPTNLLYNVVASPGALYRYWRQGQTGGRLTALLIAGTLPGVVAGGVIRVELLPSADVFDIVVAAVLLPLGGWLALGRPPENGTARAPRLANAVLVVLAAAVGCVGGIYGIGGGSPRSAAPNRPTRARTRARASGPPAALPGRRPLAGTGGRVDEIQVTHGHAGPLEAEDMQHAGLSFMVDALANSGAPSACATPSAGARPPGRSQARTGAGSPPAAEVASGSAPRSSLSCFT